MEPSDQIGQVSCRILLIRIKCNDAIVSQLLHRMALSSYGWTLNTFFLASNYHKDNEVVSISRRLQTGQHTMIACPTAIKDYNQFSHGVDLFNHRISCYNLHRKSKRNWLRIFIYFLNASIFDSFICYNQLAQDKLQYLTKVSAPL